MLMKTEMVLVQAIMYQNDIKRSLKSSRQHSYEAKHKKHQKCNRRHEKQAHPKTDVLNVPMTPRCNMGCQSYKVTMRNKLCSVRFMCFDKIEDVTHMPQI